MSADDRRRVVGAFVSASRKLMDYRQRSEAEGASEEFLAQLDAINAHVGEIIRELEENGRTFAYKGPRVILGDEGE